MNENVIKFSSTNIVSYNGNQYFYMKLFQYNAYLLGTGY